MVIILINICSFRFTHTYIYIYINVKIVRYYIIVARGRVDRVTDCGVRGPGFKSPGSILTSRIETSCLSRVVMDGWDSCSVPASGYKNSLLRWSLRLGR